MAVSGISGTNITGTLSNGSASVSQTLKDSQYNNFKDILKAMLLLEDSYLGGSGSRGYGKIKFKDIVISKRDVDYYINNQSEENDYKFETISKALSEFNE